MKLNSDALYLSLMAEAFEATIVPELQSPSAQAMAGILRSCLTELRRRQGPARTVLIDANRQARALIDEGCLLAQRLGLNANALPTVDAESPYFEALIDENAALTRKLARLARRLSTTNGEIPLDRASAIFLRRAAEWEHSLHTRLQQPLENDAPHALPALSLSALQAFLRSVHPDGESVHMHRLTRAEGGYGKQTWFATLTDRALREQQFVIRKGDRAMAIERDAFIIEREFHLLTAVAATGFPAPRPLWLGMKVPGIDGNFFVMERAAGQTPGTLLGGAERIPEHYALDLAALLARLHSIDIEAFSDYIDRYEAPSLYSETIEQCYRRSVAEWRAHVTDVSQIDSPLMEHLFAWLAEHVPRHQSRPVLVHGDFNIHNVLAGEDGHVSAVLDWECAMFGAPEQDLAYIRPMISQHIDWDRFIAHYLASGGRSPDQESLDFYGVFSAMRVMNGLIWYTRKLQTGQTRDIRLCMAELGFVAPFMGMALGQAAHASVTALNA